MESNSPMPSNDTLTHSDERWWVPLAIALPVCLVGIVLITVLVLVVIVCYSSKFKYKIKKASSGRKLSSESASQIESTDAVVSGSPYANLDQTVQETKQRATTSEPGTQTISNGGTNFAKELWGKAPWKKNNTTDLAYSEHDRNSEKTEDKIRIVDERKTKTAHSTDAGVSGSTYANLDQTVQETKQRATTSEPETHTISNGGTNFAKELWNKAPWKKNNTTDLTYSESDRNSEKTEDKIRIVDERNITDKTDHPTRVPLFGLNGIVSKHPGTDDAASKTTPEDKPLNGQVVMRKAKQKQQPEDNDNDQNKPLEKPNNHSETRKTFVVMYPMESGNDVSRLPLAVNDVIIYLDEERDGWMKGEKKQSGEVGWFPRTHVREGMTPLDKRHSLPKMKDLELTEARPMDFNATVTTPAAATTTTEAATTKMDQIVDIDDDFDDVDDDDDDYETGIEYQALYPYRALEDGDINFDAGDVIVVVERLENGWWRGYRGDEQGFFPGSYVQLKSSEAINPTDDNTNFKDGELPSPLEDLSRSVAELLPISAAGEEAEEDDDGDDGDDGSTTNKKNKNANVRRSLGLFLKSLPRKINAGRAAATDQNTSVADRAKKGEKSTIPWVKKKKKKTPNLPPLARRCSVAPEPPTSNGQRPGNALSSLAQMAAKTAQRRDVLEVTYEEIGTSGVRDRDHESGTDVSGQGHVENIDKELKSGQFYANLNGDDSTKLNKTSTVPISTGVLASEKLLRPLPPQKPNYSGSTPSIPALFSSREDTTVLGKRTEKPKVMAKPRNVPSEDAQERRSIRLPKATKPKPLTAKPNHVAPGFPDSPRSMRREFCRSLDSVLLGAGAEEEDEGELEIVKWLQRKLSAETEEHGGELQIKSPVLTPQLQHKVNGVNEGRTSDDKERMAHLLEDIFKRGPKNEESFA